MNLSSAPGSLFLSGCLRGRSRGKGGQRFPGCMGSCQPEARGSGTVRVCQAAIRCYTGHVLSPPPVAALGRRPVPLSDLSPAAQAWEEGACTLPARYSPASLGSCPTSVPRSLCRVPPVTALGDGWGKTPLSLKAPGEAVFRADASALAPKARGVTFVGLARSPSVAWGVESPLDSDVASCAPGRCCGEGSRLGLGGLCPCHKPAGGSHGAGRLPVGLWRAFTPRRQPAGGSYGAGRLPVGSGRAFPMP